MLRQGDLSRSNLFVDVLLVHRPFLHGRIPSSSALQQRRRRCRRAQIFLLLVLEIMPIEMMGVVVLLLRSETQATQTALEFPDVQLLCDTHVSPRRWKRNGFHSAAADCLLFQHVHVGIDQRGNGRDVLLVEISRSRCASGDRIVPWPFGIRIGVQIRVTVVVLVVRPLHGWTLTGRVDRGVGRRQQLRLKGILHESERRRSWWQGRYVR